MLVISRSEGEGIVFVLPDGREVVLRFLEVHRGNAVRLGFEGAGSVEIHRKEVWLKRQAEKEEQQS